MQIETMLSEQNLPTVKWIQKEIVFWHGRNEFPWRWFTGVMVVSLFVASQLTTQQQTFSDYFVLSLFMAIPALIIAQIIEWQIFVRTHTYGAKTGDKPRLYFTKPARVYGIKVRAEAELILDEGGFQIRLTKPMLLRDSPTSSDTTVLFEADDIVDFSVQDGKPWLRASTPVSFSVVVMRSRTGATNVVALHYGGEGELYHLQQILTDAFIKSRPRGGWGNRYMEQARAARRRSSDII